MFFLILHYVKKQKKTKPMTDIVTKMMIAGVATGSGRLYWNNIYTITIDTVIDYDNKI